jgi:hypothetical protein
MINIHRLRSRPVFAVYRLAYDPELDERPTVENDGEYAEFEQAMERAVALHLVRDDPAIDTFYLPTQARQRLDDFVRENNIEVAVRHLGSPR